MKVGDVYYTAYFDDEDHKVEITEHILRTIRGKWGYLVQKEDFTWGKRSRKTGDYGWLDPIPDWCRKKFLVANGPPKGFARSKSQALRLALACVKGNLAGRFMVEYSTLAVKAYEARIKREMTAKKKSKEARRKPPTQADAAPVP